MTRDLDWWADLAPQLHWTYSKSMPQWPHSYVVKARDLDPDTFVDAVKVIRRYGEPGKFYSKTRIYLHLDGQRYWAMGRTENATVEEVTVINIATDDTDYGIQDAPSTRSGIETVYDHLAPVYDARYTSPECQAENQRVAHLAAALTDHGFTARPRVLDIGAGTGLTLDLGITTPDRYWAVDPSQAMLNELVIKHPATRHLHPGLFTADLAAWFTQFDLVTALFGVASYLDPDTIATIPQCLTDSGRGLLMGYTPGYLPDYHHGTLPTQGPAHEALLDVAVDIMEIGNYTVATI